LKMGDEGPAVLFLHGFGGDLNSWMFNQPQLAMGRTSFAFDLPGHGDSDKNLNDGALEALSATAAGVMDSLGIDSAHLVGHSLGGAIALRLAADHPGRVLSLTLISTAGL